MSAGDVHSILYRGNDLFKEFQPKYDPTKRVTRHWPGHGEEEEEEDEGRDGEEQPVVDTPIREIDTKQQDIRMVRLAMRAPTTSMSERIQERVKRFQQMELEQEESERRARGEAPPVEPVVMDSETIVLESSEMSEIAKERQKRKEAARKKREAEEKKLDEMKERESFAGIEDEESESDYDSDYEESKDLLARPLYVPPSQRITAKQKEVLEQEQQERIAEQKKKLAERKHESHQMLIEHLHNEANEKHKSEKGEKAEKELQALPDDSDDVNDAEEYELWKIRELTRIRREKEEELKDETFRQEIERRRNLTEEERRRDNRRLDELQPKVETIHKYAFMQKYYHKGAFFQDKTQTGEEALYLRDYAAPVGEDKLDKLNAPKAMRLRRGEMGRAGQTKHTHLVDVDTSTKDNPWTKGKAGIHYKKSEANTHFERPTKTRKR